MILIDTDHLSVLIDRRHALRAGLIARLEAAGDTPAVAVVTVEEQLRGWLAEIHRVRNAHKQIVPYMRLVKLLDFLREWRVVGWNEPAAEAFTQLRPQQRRMGTRDLMIAATALSNDALLLSANLRDFERVPNLRVEDWLYE